MESIAASELILNADQSIYHLNLLPDDIADTIITVGDPNRVPAVSQHFDRIETIKQKREFLTHTGYIGDERLSVISTGMGAGNIDIFMNEIDALLTIDFNRRVPLSEKRSARIIRLGTSGSLHPDIHPGDLVVSRYAIGFDAAMAYYPYEEHIEFGAFLRAYGADVPCHYITDASEQLNDKILPNARRGITLTSPGFYAAQNRSIRLPSAVTLPFDAFHKFGIEGVPITNMEMETSCLYLLGQLLGHDMLSVNCILANRLHGTFSTAAKKDVGKMIELFLSDLLG